ncbi:hypothetical protein FCH28_03020 [Streptomyces piniterrae]|uniref:BL00235/CARNS1 N-terminal domain-containing protein n=1 Tax=Streptomyces piniterrae TaxID=2571125 RepID=A0A4U0NWE4_9ACTN|nr:hypothetical protein [Streptomyces piniterrae]TJZ59116.1 hypothetical protein FCH28_03020 [Streptomyces piniterrae]
MTPYRGGAFAIVETQVSDHGLSLLRAAHELGYYTVLVSSDPDLYCALPCAHEAFTRHVDHIIETDTTSADAIVEALSNLPVGRRVLGVCTGADDRMVPTADVARQLGLPGLSPRTARVLRSRSLLRSVCAQAGISVVARPRRGWRISAVAVYVDGAHRVLAITPTAAPHRKSVDLVHRALTAVGHAFGAAHVELTLSLGQPRLVQITGMPSAELARLALERSGVHLPYELVRLTAGLASAASGPRRLIACSQPFTPSSGMLLRVVPRPWLPCR